MDFTPSPLEPHEPAGKSHPDRHSGLIAEPIEPIEAAVAGASVEFYDRTLASPLALSSGVIRQVTEARATVTVRAGGREATGHGSVYLSHRWAWPSAAGPPDACDATLRDVCRLAAERLDELCGARAAHPWELGLRLHAAGVDDWVPDADTRLHADARRRFAERLPSDLPPLARILCLSPFDAALHDAVGRLFHRSAFRLYDRPQPIPAIDARFPHEGACSALQKILRPTPRRLFPATLVVGPLDPLDEHLDRWVVGRRYRRVKLKIAGRDPDQDARQIEAVAEGLRARGVTAPELIVDANEALSDANQTARLLDRIAARPAAWAALRYLEQPTGRDLNRPTGDWSPVVARRPVVIDEALTSPTTLARAVDGGWSGAALKTCKGHSLCLFAAAWLHARRRLVVLQDLTNPGFAAIHAALFAAFVPTANGVELNSPQFTPEANADWLPRLAPLLEPTDGVHRLPAAVPAGLGSDW